MVLCDNGSYGRTRRETSRSATSKLQLYRYLFQLCGWKRLEPLRSVQMHRGTLLGAVREKTLTLATWCIAVPRITFCPELSLSDVTLCSGSKYNEAEVKSVTRGLDGSSSFGLLVLLKIQNLSYESYRDADL